MKNVKSKKSLTGTSLTGGANLQNVISTGINTNISTSSGLLNSNSTITIAGSGAVNAIYGNGYGSNWGSGSFTIQKTKYVILGEDFETSNYFDATVGMAIALINVLGKPYWLELKRQNVSLGIEIDTFIENRITILDRDKKIDDLLS